MDVSNSILGVCYLIMVATMYVVELDNYPKTQIK